MTLSERINAYQSEQRAQQTAQWTPSYAKGRIGEGYAPVIVDRSYPFDRIVWEANTNYASPSDAIALASIILDEYRTGSIDLTTIHTTK